MRAFPRSQGGILSFFPPWPCRFQLVPQSIQGSTPTPSGRRRCFRAHLPKGMRQLALVQFMHIIHGERMGGVRMHYHAVLRLHAQSCHMTHQMRGQFGGEASAIPVAHKSSAAMPSGEIRKMPRFCSGSASTVFKILPRSGYDQDAACQRRCVKAQGDGCGLLAARSRYCATSDSSRR